MYVVKSEDTFDLLANIVSETKCKPGWSFRLTDDEGAMRLIIRIRDFDNYPPYGPKTIDHVHPVPITTYNEKSWRRWIFDQCLRTMNHEIGESLRFTGEGLDPVRPFAPMHGPGEDPYTVHETRPEIDALTTQDGSLRAGPV